MTFPPTEPEKRQFAGELAAVSARNIWEAVHNINGQAVQAAVDSAIDQIPAPEGQAEQQVHDKVKTKSNIAQMIGTDIPTAERFAEAFQIMEFPFFELCKARQRLEVNGDFERVFMLYLMAHPGLAGAAMVTSFTSLKIKFMGPRSKRAQAMKSMSEKYLAQMMLDPTMSKENVGWNDWHYCRYCVLGRPEDLDEIVKRYAGQVEPANNPNRAVITSTCRWMVNSLREHHSWFKRHFEKAWRRNGHTAALPLVPDIIGAMLGPNPTRPGTVQ